MSGSGAMGRGMGSRMWLLCLLLSVHGILGQSSKMPDFALFVPPDIYVGLENNFCLHCSPRDLEGFTNMSVDLKTSSGSETLYIVQPDSPTWKCLPLKAPEPSGSTEKVTIIVYGHRSDGEKVELSSKELTARKINIQTFIQADKAFYKAAQNVHFRIVTLNQNLDVKKTTYQLVEIQDPQKNRLAQWKNVGDDSGITDLSYQLSPDAALGKYTIKADGKQLDFIVDEYVLPKFETLIEAPPSISMLDEEVPVSVSGLYTYGEKVPGNANFKICQKKRPRWRYWWRSEEKEDDKRGDLCHTHAAKTDSSGKVTSLVKLSDFDMRNSDYSRELQVEASMEEEGTEIKFNATKKTIRIQSQLTKLSFKDCKKYFQPGVPFTCKLVLESHDGKRLSGKKVHLNIPKTEGTAKETYITNSEGEVSFQLPTSEWKKDSLSLRATTDDEDEPYVPNKVSLRYGSASIYLQELHVTTKRSVSIRPINSLEKSGGSVPVTVDFSIDENEEGDSVFYYVVMDKNRLTHGGQQTVKKPDSRSGSFQFTFPYKDNSESGKLMVFTKSPSGGIAADITGIQVPAALKHKVSLKFAESESLPGSENKLHLQANGDSMCALRAVDKSVVMMKPEAELTESKIQNLVPTQRSYIYSQGADYNMCRDQKPEPEVMGDDPIGMWGRRGGWYSYAEKKKDFKNVIEENGCHILTSWNIVAPTKCKFNRHTYHDAVPKMARPVAGKSNNDKVLKKAKPAAGATLMEGYSSEEEMYDDVEGMLIMDSPMMEGYSSEEEVGMVLSDFTGGIRSMGRPAMKGRQPGKNRPLSGMASNALGSSPMMDAGPYPYGIMSLSGPGMVSSAFGSRPIMDGAAAPPGAPMDSATSNTADADDGSGSETRTMFPETWLWELQKVNENGSAEMSVKVPDTITEWSAQSFCVGPGGFGLSQPVTLKTFKSFFLDLLMPYSVKREESFVLKANVFNYLPSPMMISASLPSSEHFKTEKSKTSEKLFCLPGGAKKTVSWVVTPSIIGQMNTTIVAEAVKSQELCGGKETVIPKKGRRDVVIQSVLVVPEGTAVEKTHNSLLITDGNSVTEKVKLELPSSFVPGSQKAFISVCGDIMGTAMDNIGDLMAMSYGCGEQNMVKLAPNVYILQYLNTSKQITPALEAKAKDFLQSGYTRQLNYKHEDGSYSAFGKSDKEGNTWLTAFVMKSIRQIDCIYIDPLIIQKSVDWLKDQQMPNGCFRTRGRLLNNAMKGGVDDERSLTSYVVAAYMESGSDPSDPVVEKGLKCIQSEPLQNATTYKMALMAYMYTLAGDEKNRAAVMEKLSEKASKADGLLYWTQETKHQSESYWSKAKSVDVEMTSYVFLSYACRKNPTKQELGDMAAINRWLSKQQNPRGGFSSTQDTVVALQAMSMFATHTMKKGGKTTIEVTNEKGFQHRFQVDDDNRLLQQKIQLPEIPGDYTITAAGSGTVIAQVTQVHNALPVPKEDVFDMSAKPQCMKGNKMAIMVDFSYKGERPCTNMALMEVNFLSGYEPSEESLSDLKKVPGVNRVEKSEDCVSIYLEKVTNEKQTLEIHVERKVEVKDLKSAVIKLFDYYKRDEEKAISYVMTC